MDEINIGRALEGKQDQDDQKELNSVIEEDFGAGGSDGKKIIFAVIAIIGIFVLSFGGFKVYDYVTAANVVDIDTLHQDNLEGSLDQEEGYLYNGYSFVKVDGLWWTEMVRGETLVKIPLHFGPQEIEDIPVTGTFLEEFTQEDKVYVAIDPTVISGHYVVAMKELSSNIAQGKGITTEGACTEEHYLCEDRQILNCEDNKGLVVIELEIAETSAIEVYDRCIKIKGQEYGIIKAADKLIYQWYGIMD